MLTLNFMILLDLVFLVYKSETKGQYQIKVDYQVKRAMEYCKQ